MDELERNEKRIDEIRAAIRALNDEGSPDRYKLLSEHQDILIGLLVRRCKLLADEIPD